jgi:hypothetical protein
MRIFLITLLLMFGTQAAAERDVYGSNAVELVLRAHEKGLILDIDRKKTAPPSFFIKFLLEGRYYQCNFKARDQSCSDFTGSFGEYEEQ